MGELLESIENLFLARRIKDFKISRLRNRHCKNVRVIHRFFKNVEANCRPSVTLFYWLLNVTKLSKRCGKHQCLLLRFKQTEASRVKRFSELIESRLHI